MKTEIKPLQTSKGPTMTDNMITEAFPEVSKRITEGKDALLWLLASKGLLTTEEARLWCDECEMHLVYIGDPKDEELAMICTPPKKYRGH